jgi:hypothetical protein
MGTAAWPVHCGSGRNTGSRPLLDALNRALTMEIHTERCSGSIGKDITCWLGREGGTIAWGERSRRAKSGEKFRGAGARFDPGKSLTTYPRTGRTQLDTWREHGCAELVIPVRRLSASSSLRACWWILGWCSSACKADLERRRSILIARGRERWLHGVCWSRRPDSARGTVVTPAMLGRVRWDDVADALGPGTEARRAGAGRLCRGPTSWREREGAGKRAWLARRTHQSARFSGDGLRGRAKWAKFGCLGPTAPVLFFFLCFHFPFLLFSKFKFKF